MWATGPRRRRQTLWSCRGTSDKPHDGAMVARSTHAPDDTRLPPYTERRGAVTGRRPDTRSGHQLPAA